MSRAKKFWKKYKYEIVLVSIGSLAGYSIAKRRYGPQMIHSQVVDIKTKTHDDGSRLIRLFFEDGTHEDWKADNKAA